LLFPNADYTNISLHIEGGGNGSLKASLNKTTEGTMTKVSSISLIAGAALFGMAALSIVSAFNGRVAFDDQPDAMVTQLYVPNVGTNDVRQQVVASQVSPSGYQVPR
jgi:hypothetical protein